MELLFASRHDIRYTNSNNCFEVLSNGKKKSQTVFVFRCLSQRFKGGTRRDVCIPLDPPVQSDRCNNDFDCGYSTLEGRWSRCLGGSCVRVVE